MLAVGCALASMAIAPASALPPVDDLPEEVLRTEIITEARSPLDGSPLTAAEYAELQAEFETRQDEFRPPVSRDIAEVIRLLYLRRAIRSVFPFLLP
ncbi:hypothetical protein IQ268_26900 [Oculatella sp. LEGE 06141]|nr:hypothetical protein [Oculatella sp. LEGE 06141]